MQRKTESDYRELAAQSGVRWMGGTLPADVLTRTLWKCARGHLFEMRYANLQMGRTCPVCSQRYRRRIDDYRKMGEAHGVIWSGKAPPRNIRIPTLWRLPDGRVLTLPYRSLAARRRRLDEIEEKELRELLVEHLELGEAAEEIPGFGTGGFSALAART